MSKGRTDIRPFARNPRPLLAAMAAAGRHGTARRLYRIYGSRMSELEVEPAAFPVTA